jgi:hypothetical protein
MNEDKGMIFTTATKRGALTSEGPVRPHLPHPLRAGPGEGGGARISRCRRVPGRERPAAGGARGEAEPKEGATQGRSRRRARHRGRAGGGASPRREEGEGGLAAQ